MPINWIALPFYSKLSEKWRNKVSTRSNDVKLDIDFDRTELLSVINNIPYQSKNTNKYTQIIIVATNIAEASITINTLSVVVDLGYQISVSYDPLTMITKNETIKITEASRIQRKGRVGRTKPGYVYYIYQKDGDKTSCNTKNIFLGSIEESKEVRLNYNLKYLPNLITKQTQDILHKITSKEGEKPKFGRFRNGKGFTIDSSKGKYKYIYTYNKYNEPCQEFVLSSSVRVAHTRCSGNCRKRGL
jgi:hypothetical protein